MAGQPQTPTQVAIEAATRQGEGTAGAARETKAGRGHGDLERRWVSRGMKVARACDPGQVP